MSMQRQEAFKFHNAGDKWIKARKLKRKTQGLREPVYHRENLRGSTMKQSDAQGDWKKSLIMGEATIIKLQIEESKSKDNMTHIWIITAKVGQYGINSFLKSSTGIGSTFIKLTASK